MGMAETGSALPVFRRPAGQAEAGPIICRMADPNIEAKRSRAVMAASLSHRPHGGKTWRKRAQRRKRVAGPLERHAGEAAVVAHAADQVGDAVEPHLGPDPADESDVEDTAVEIAGEIEQEHLQ